jgi:hypothetical protein
VLRGMQPAPEQRPVARPAEEAALEAEQQGRDLDGQALQELEPAQPGRDPAGLELQRPEWAPPPLVREQQASLEPERPGSPLLAVAALEQPAAGRTAPMALAPVLVALVPVQEVRRPLRRLPAAAAAVGSRLAPRAAGGQVAARAAVAAAERAAVESAERQLD